MTRREVLLAAAQYRDPPYVPWHVTFTADPKARMAERFRTEDLDAAVGNHMIQYRPPTRRHEEVRPGIFRDRYGSLWDRTMDKDIGAILRPALAGPTLKGFAFPRCEGGEEAVRAALDAHPNLARCVSIGFTLFERAWALRGMEDLLMDFVERPAFVHELFDAILEHDLEILQWALQFDPDIVHFGDDWGQQHGLIMGPKAWREFLKPRLKRLYDRAREAGKLVSIHTCGDVSGILDDLIEIGVNLFNPFQPEVMDVAAVKRRYHGRLAFHGGLSIQRVLPFGTPDEVGAATLRLLREIGQGGGYVFAPAHAVPADVPTENIMAFLEVLWAQDGAPGN